MTVNGAAGVTRDEMLAVLAAPDTASLDDGLNALTAYVESLAGPVPDGRRRDRARLGQPAVRPGRLRLAAAVPRRAGAQLRCRAPRGRLRGRHRGGAHRHQRLDRRADPRPDPRDHPRGRDRRPDPAGAGQRAVLQGALADAVRGRRHHRRRVPPRRRVDGVSADDARQRRLRRGRRLARGAPRLRRRHPGHDRGAARRGPEADLDALVAGGGLPDLLALAVRRGRAVAPRWKFLVAAPLDDALDRPRHDGGVRPAAADFSAMATEDDLVVARVLQQVFIAVDEAGTEAAAATAVRGGRDQRAGASPRSRWSSTGRSCS